MVFGGGGALTSRIDDLVLDRHRCEVGDQEEVVEELDGAGLALVAEDWAFAGAVGGMLDRVHRLVLLEFSGTGDLQWRGDPGDRLCHDVNEKRPSQMLSWGPISRLEYTSD